MSNIGALCTLVKNQILKNWSKENHHQNIKFLTIGLFETLNNQIVKVNRKIRSVFRRHTLSSLKKTVRVSIESVKYL